MLRNALVLGAIVSLGCGTKPPFDMDAGDTDSSMMDFDATLNTDGRMDASCTTNGSSADLHTILDCNGNKIMDCPPTQACGAGMCMPPCDAAKANKASIGCEYYTFRPRATSFECFAMYVANTWNAPITIDVDFAGTKLNVSQFARIPVGTGTSLTYKNLTNGNQLQPNEVAILSLYAGPNSSGCPSAGANMQGMPTAADVSLTGPGYGKTYHVTTTAPIVAYQIDPYSFGGGAVASSTLLIPTSAWDTNYIAVTPWPKITNTTQPKLDLIGFEDGTMVTILPSADIIGGNGVANATQNKPQTYTLNKGQLLQFEQDIELTGSVIQATKPVAVFGAQNCVNIAACCCDSENQQIAPVRALGSEYAAVRYRDRLDDGMHVESGPWRIVGAVKGTTLTWLPSKPMTAPSTLDVGQVVDFRDPGYFVVKSQDDNHPFYLGNHMTGGNGPWLFNNYGPGDPEWMNTVPPAEWLPAYGVFMGPSYKDSSLVFLRKKQGDGTFKDVKLDCKGTLTGWKAISGTDYEYARLDIVIANVPQLGCDTGLRTASSTATFGLNVWGWSHDSSYGYPAGMSVKAVNQVVVPPNPN